MDERTGPDEPPPKPPRERWTGIDDYLSALARRRTARRKREGSARRRTQPEEPRASLSTWPFLALLAAMALLAAAILVGSWPGQVPRPAPKPHEQGKADPGWFEEAKKEFR